MKFLKDLFSENNHASSLRVMSMITCIAAIIIAIIGLNKDVIDYSGLTLLCTSFLTVAFTGKVVQKRFEQPKDK